MAGLEEIRKVRIEKLKAMRAVGLEPYPARAKPGMSLVKTVTSFDKIFQGGQEIVLVGRIMSLRPQGALVFFTLKDGTGSLQGLLKQSETNDADFKNFGEFADIGDFVEVLGKLFLTARGEKTILVKSWRMLSKSLRPLPEKWHGLQDPDEKLRKRYLDLLLDDEARASFEKKAKFWDTARKFMKDRGFLEVETPTLEITTGGAEATPFRTHHNDLDMDVYLRISVGELWQKRLMAAGFPKTFEIGRIYRNEGTDANHVQEFTNLEFYWAYANYEDGMKFTEELYRVLASEVFGQTRFESRDHTFDLKDPWPRMDYVDAVHKATGIDVLKDSDEKMEAKLKELKVVYDGKSRERLVDSLWKYCRRQISGPVFLINHPKLVSPLSKIKSDNPELTERFQIILCGTEVGNGFSELNDPLDQRERFEIQQKLIAKGDKEAMMPDWEFVEMLEYGMPPTCGFGFGESLFAILADRPMRETQMFPLVRPKK